MYTIGDWVRVNFERNPSTEALVSTEGRVTFGEAAVRAWQLARGLHKIGLKTGSSVGVLASNTIFNAESFLGIGTAGMVYGAYNWRWSAAELAQGIIESRASIILAEDPFIGKLTEAINIIDNELIQAADFPIKNYQSPKIITESEIDQYRIGGSERFDSGVSPQAPLALSYTGGSTGTPKAVMLSHQNATSNFLNEHLDVELGQHPNERGLIVTPMFHIAALFCWFVSHFASGKTSVFTNKFDEEDFQFWVESEKITNTFLVPNMLRRLMQNGVFDQPGVAQNISAMHTGAGLLRMPDKHNFFEKVPNAKLYFRYGLTEAGPMATRLLHKHILDEAVDGSIGQAYTFADVEVRNIDGSSDQVAAGEVGEICVRGPSIMLGYFNRPKETAEVLSSDGWLRTGDLAHVDENGFIFFHDRLKEMIKTGGENVYSAEVEQALYLHPAVLEAAVLGVPDEKWDEEVRAVISLRKNAEVSAKDLQEFLRSHIAGYKIPKEIVFLPAEQLPRSAAGKLVKTQLKHQLGWTEEFEKVMRGTHAEKNTHR